MKTSPTVLVDALVAGIPVTFGENVHRLFRPGESVPTPRGPMEAPVWWLGVQMHMGDGTEVYLGTDLDIALLLNRAAKMPEDQLAELAAQVAFTKQKRSEAKQRTRL